MAKYAVDELVREVRVAIDENQAEEACLSSSPEQLELDGIILSKLPEAAAWVALNCPLWMAGARPAEVQAADVASRADGTGSIRLPDSFLRFAGLKMKGWKRPVSVPFAEGSPEALRQANPHVRGNPSKPACVLARDAEGRPVAEYYSVGPDTAPEVERLLYVPKPEAKGGEMEIPGILKEAVVHCCAGMAEDARGNAAQAERFYASCKGFFKEAPM